MVVTLGFSNDPDFSVLNESQWRLSIDRGEDLSIQGTWLVAETEECTTVFEPPIFGSEIDPLAWLALQWWKDEAGQETRRARRRITVLELIETLPPEFHEWVYETTERALEWMERSGSEGMTEAAVDLEDRAVLAGRAAELRDEVEKAEAREQRGQRRQERLYGDIYVYDLPPDVDLYWRLDSISDGSEALVVRPEEMPNDRLARAFVPPNELLDWRWTTPLRPAQGGEYLPPGEVIARVPRDFHGWVATKTHEALQAVRQALYLQAAGTLANAEDLAQVIRLAQHAQRLSVFTSPVGTEILEELEGEDGEEHIGVPLGPDGRVVVLAPSRWRHILAGPPEMEDHLEAVMETIESPDHREPDPRPGRERFFRRGGPEKWVRVVIEVDGPVDRVVTAFPQSNEPSPTRRRM